MKYKGNKGMKNHLVVTSITLHQDVLKRRAYLFVVRVDNCGFEEGSSVVHISNAASIKRNANMID